MLFFTFAFSYTLSLFALLEKPQAFRERIKALQIKITARNGRINLLIQRGTPDLEPLDS